MHDQESALRHTLRIGKDRPGSFRRIGDCEAPSIIAAAVYSGHRYAQELDAGIDPDNRMKYDRVFFDDE